MKLIGDPADAKGNNGYCEFGLLNQSTHSIKTLLSNVTNTMNHIEKQTD